MDYNENSDIESIPGYQWWKKEMGKYLLRKSIMLFCVLTIFSLIAWSSFASEITLYNILIGLFLLLLFVKMLKDVKKYITAPNWQVDRYWYGTIVDKKIISRKKRKILIFVDVGNGEILKGRCFSDTYYRAKEGQSILVFSIGDGKIYCVHADMKND